MKDFKVIMVIKQGQKKIKAPLFGVADHGLKAGLYAALSEPVATL